MTFSKISFFLFLFTLALAGCPNGETNNCDESLDADCDGVLTLVDCNDSDANDQRSRLDDRDCDSIPATNDCDDTNAEITTVKENDADCDGTPTEEDCNDELASSTIKDQDGDCDGLVTGLDCDDADADNTQSSANDKDCDEVVTADDCNDNDANITTTLATDADCDGVMTSEDCDDADGTLGALAQDGDCDGYLTEEDCDDDDDQSLPKELDQDCDGFAMLSDCDDTDETSNNIGNDRDCDGYQNENDCHPDQAIDDHPKSIDMDCDDILFEVDCDDNNPDVLEREADLDCDGALTADDCDDDDPSVMALMDDVDCDGALNDGDTCPQQFNPAQIDPDRDGFGQECGDDESDFFIFSKPNGTEGTDGPEYRDCITPNVCITRDLNAGPYNYESGTAHSLPGFSATLMDEDYQSTTGTVYSEFTGYSPFGLDMEYYKNKVLTFRVDVAEDLSGEDGGTLQVDPDYAYYDVMFHHWNNGSIYTQDDFGNLDIDNKLPINRGSMSYGRAKAIHFNKDAYLDYTLPSNQDCITPSVCLARANTQSIYNVSSESSADDASPLGTRWAKKRTLYATDADYGTFKEMHGDDPQSLVWADKSQEPTIVSLHIVKENLFYDVVLHSYSGNANGGGFSYTRTRALVAGCTNPDAAGYNPAANLEDGTCGSYRSIKPDNSDWRLAQNQLCLSETLCLSRGAGAQLFNPGNGELSEIQTFNTDILSGSAAHIDLAALEIRPGFETSGGSNNVQHISIGCDFLNDFRNTIILQGIYHVLENTSLDEITGSDVNHLRNNPYAFSSALWRSANGDATGDGVLKNVYEIILDAGPASLPDGGVLEDAGSPEPQIIIEEEAVFENIVLVLPPPYVNPMYADYSLLEFKVLEESVPLPVPSFDGGIPTSDGSVLEDAGSASESLDAGPPPDYCHIQIEYRYNIDELVSSRQRGSPLNTRWALGTTEEVTSELSYLGWSDSFGGGPSYFMASETPQSLYDCVTHEFYDVRIMQWTGGGSGGGFDIAWKPVLAPEWFEEGLIQCHRGVYDDDYSDQMP